MQDFFYSRQNIAILSGDASDFRQETQKTQFWIQDGTNSISIMVRNLKSNNYTDHSKGISMMCKNTQISFIIFKILGTLGNFRKFQRSV